MYLHIASFERTFSPKFVKTRVRQGHPSHEQPPHSPPPSAASSIRPLRSLDFRPADEPTGVPQSETFPRFPRKGTTHYLVSTVPANTKYSVNRQFIPVGHFPFSAPHAHAKLKATERSGSRNEPLKPRKIWKLSTGPDFFRPRPKQRRMTHKRRLVSSRQGFVFVTFVTPISCVSVMWITGRNYGPGGGLGPWDAQPILLVLTASSLTKSSWAALYRCATPASYLRSCGKEIRP